MRVGILTLTYDNDNFGAHLQAWALKYAILKLNSSIISGVIPLIDHPNYHIRVLEKYPKDISFLRQVLWDLLNRNMLFIIKYTIKNLLSYK